MFKNYFNNIVGNLDIHQNLEYKRDSFNEDPVLTSIEKYDAHPSIKNIESRMNDINSNFFFKFIDQGQVFKEITLAKK